MNQLYCFTNDQAEPVIIIVQDKKKVEIHREIFVVADSESAARVKAKRKQDGENGLGDDYRLFRVDDLGKQWN